MLAAALCWLGPVVAVQAQPSPPPIDSGLSLGWARGPGAESCISPSALTRRVEAQLGSARFGTAHNALLTVEGAVGPNNENNNSLGFVATIAVSDSTGRIHGRRELKTEFGCRELDEGLALIIAVTVRSSTSGLSPTASAMLEALFADAPSDLSPPETSKNVPSSLGPFMDTVPPTAGAGHPREPKPLKSPPLPVAPDSTASATSIAFYAGGLIASGLGPAAALGPSLGLAWLEADYGRLVAWGSWGLNHGDVTVFDPTVTGGRIDGRAHGLGMLWAVGLSACPIELQSPQFEASICLDGQLGQVQLERTTGFGVFDQDTLLRRLWINAGPSLELRREFDSGLFVWLAGRGTIAIRRAEYRYVATDGTSQRLFRSDLLAAQAGLGLGFHWAP